MCVIFSHLIPNCDGGVNKICSGLSSRDDFDAGADNETFRAPMTIETDILLETYANKCSAELLLLIHKSEYI